jgi:Putative  PD-(D/E)XK family member, (DUF4420)
VSELNEYLRRLAADIENRDSDSSDVFIARELRGFPGIRLARNAEGVAVLIPGSTVRAPLELEHLRARFSASCQVRTDGAVRQETLTVVQYIGHSPQLEGLFLDALSLLLARKSLLSADSVAAFVNGLCELLEPSDVVGEEILIGLWGELFVIAHSSDPSAAIAAWHRDPAEKFDFALGSERVEVKTTIGRRVHDFSLAQIRPLAPLDVTVISIQTSRGVGPSIRELTEQILSEASTVEASDKVLATVFKTLGGGDRFSLDREYDGAMAIHTMRIFPGSFIPAFESVPAEISKVRFTIDLSNVENQEFPRSRTALAMSLAPVTI